ncbi:unnamed protein product, partial [Prunus brigantina]
TPPSLSPHATPPSSSPQAKPPSSFSQATPPFSSLYFLSFSVFLIHLSMFLTTFSLLSAYPPPNLIEANIDLGVATKLVFRLTSVASFSSRCFGVGFQKLNTKESDSMFGEPFTAWFGSVDQHYT